MTTKELDLLSTIDRALGLESGTTTAETTSEDLAEWDSLAQVGLIAEIEAAIGDQLTPREISRMTSVPSILAILDARDIACVSV